MSRDETNHGCNTFVRYLLDAQLFTVPNNQQHFSYLLAYLHHERLFDLTYVVAMRDRQIRGSAGGGSWWSGTEDGVVAETVRRRRRRRHREDETDVGGESSLANKIRARRNNNDGDRDGHDDDDDEIEATETSCTLMYDDLVTCAAPPIRRPAKSTIGHALSVRPPTTRYDVRDLFQNVVLTGDENEWLELKLQLCLPSIMVFVKLDGSKTTVPNADKTLILSMRELQALHDKRTLGEKLAMILAEFRRRYFDAPLPSMQQIAFLATVDAYEIEERAPPPPQPQLKAASSVSSLVSSQTTEQPSTDPPRSPSPPQTVNAIDELDQLFDSSFTEVHEARDGDEELNDQRQQLRQQNHRQLLGGGRIERVLLLQEYD